LPHLWPTCSSSGSPPLITARYFSSNPSDSGSLRTPCPPGYAEWLQVRLGCFRLSPACPFRLLHTLLLSRPARHYPRFWIQRPSSERRGDFNPHDSCAAQRTLCRLLTSPPRSRASRPAQSGLPDATEISRGKTDRLPCTPAGFTTPSLDDDGLRNPLLARPAG
jgi:hypothetical protein